LLVRKGTSFSGSQIITILTALVLDSRAHQVRWDGLAATSEWFPSQIHKSQQLGAVI